MALEVKQTRKCDGCKCEIFCTGNFISVSILSEQTRTPTSWGEYDFCSAECLHLFALETHPMVIGSVPKDSRDRYERHQKEVERKS